MATGLSLNDVVSVSVVLTPPPIQFRNFGTLLIAGASDVIDVSERIRVYTTLAGVQADFGTTAAETLAATIYFSQANQPTQIEIGRWAKVATKGVLHGAVFSAAQQVSALLALQAISAGSMTISVDGTPRTVSALDFTGITNLNGAATIIQAALIAAGATGASVTWAPDSNKRFNVVSGTTGASSTVGYAVAGGGGTDLTVPLKLTAVTGASAPVAGIAAETALAAASALIGPTMLFGSYAFAFAPALFADLSDADIEAVAGLIEGYSPSHTFWVTNNSSSIIDPVSTSDLASVLQSLSYNRTFLQYATGTPHAAMAAFAKFAVIDPRANNTMITLKFKVETGVVAETLTETQATALKTKNANVFVNYATPGDNVNTVTAILQEGVMSGGQFADTMWGADWLQNDVQVRVFNLLYSNPTKIPQTDPGINQIQATVEAGLGDAVFNGWAAPGQWNAPGFGQLATGQYLPKGYYVYSAPLSQQDQSQRAARHAPLMQCAVKLAGAIHFANVQINVNP